MAARRIARPLTLLARYAVSSASNPPCFANQSLFRKPLVDEPVRLPFAVRWFLTSQPSADSDVKRLTKNKSKNDEVDNDAGNPQIAGNLLEGLNSLHLKARLEDEAASRPFLPLEEFIKLARRTGAAASDKDAEELLAAFTRSGVVLRHLDIVYLRPTEVASCLVKALPASQDRVQERLAEVEQELALLDAKHKEISRKAQRVPNLLLYGGCSILLTQLLAFIYLTWWELSWDVMEPIAYIISLFYSLVGFVYFITRDHDFDYGSIKQHYTERGYEAHAKKAGFDRQHYEQLQKTAARYRQLAALAKRV